MRFSTRVILLQLLTVFAVVATSTVLFIGLSVAQLRDEAETSALMIARTVAADPAVRAEVSQESHTHADPPREVLEEGTLQEFATATTTETGALFVVITDSSGIRLAHPNPERLDEHVSTSDAEAMAGRELIVWERGTLGESTRAKVPVFDPETHEPVGQVAVGFERRGVLSDLPRTLVFIFGGAALALAIGIAATLILRRRWEQLTLGVQPEELVVLVQNQAAVLDGVGDGVLALDTDGVIRLSNGAANKIFEKQTPEGWRLSDLGLDADVVADLEAGIARDGVVSHGRVLYLESRTVDRGGQSLGSVIVVRDRTDVEALSQRLDSVRAMTSALRVQRHEFHNRMHVASGLVEAGRVGEASEFLRTMRDRGPVEYPLIGADLLTEPFLQSFLGAKSLEAAERGVQLQIRDETLVLGKVIEVEDAATVLGNLVDNAVTAALKGDEQPLVEVTLLDEASDLVVVVADSGPGIAPGVDVFEHKPADADAQPDRVHGRGIGLTISRDLVARRGGDIWVIEPGGGDSGRGAIFGARLPGVMDPGDYVSGTADQEDED